MTDKGSVFRIYAEADRRMAARKNLEHRRKLMLWLGGPYLALVMVCVALSPVSRVVAFWLGLTVATILLYLGKLIRED